MEQKINNKVKRILDKKDGNNIKFNRNDNKIIMTDFVLNNLKKDQNYILDVEKLFTFYKKWSKNNKLNPLTLASFNRYIKSILPIVGLKYKITLEKGYIKGYSGINIRN